MDSNHHDNERPSWALRLAPEIDPPPGILEAIVGDLRSRHIVREPAGSRWRRLAAAAALIIVAYAAGWISHATTSGPVTPADPRYALFLIGETSGTAADDRVAEYGAWARALRSQGRSVSGERLAGGAVNVAPPAAASGMSGVTGFFIIEAASRAEAVALAEGHPHVRHGGGIVVRPIEPTAR